MERLDKQEKEIMQEIWENRIDKEDWNTEYWAEKLKALHKKKKDKELRQTLNSLRFKRYINFIGTQDAIKDLYVMDDGLDYMKRFRFLDF